MFTSWGKTIPVCIYPLKVNNKNTRKRCEICSKLTIKTSKRHHWCRSGVFIVNFQHISQLVLVFLLLTLNMQLAAGMGALMQFNVHKGGSETVLSYHVVPFFVQKLLFFNSYFSRLGDSFPVDFCFVFVLNFVLFISLVIFFAC